MIRVFLADIDYFDRKNTPLDLPFGILYDVNASWEMTSVINSIYNRLESSSGSEEFSIQDIARDVSLPFVNAYEIIQTLVAIDKNNMLTSIRSLNNIIKISEKTVRKMYYLIGQTSPF